MKYLEKPIRGPMMNRTTNEILKEARKTKTSSFFLNLNCTPFNAGECIVGGSIVIIQSSVHFKQLISIHENKTK